MELIDAISISCCIAAMALALICRTRLKRYTRLRRMAVLMRDGSTLECWLIGEGKVADGGLMVLDAGKRPFILRVAEVEDWRIEG